MGKRSKHKTNSIPLKQKFIGDRNLSLQERLENNEFLPKGHMTIVQSPGEKMSEVLLSFANPLLKGDEDDSELDRIIGFVMIVWNLTVLSPEERKNAIPGVAGLFSSDTGQGIAGTLSLIDTLLKRKEKYFSHIKKLIVDYEISQKQGQPSLKVISAPY